MSRRDTNGAARSLGAATRRHSNKGARSDPVNPPDDNDGFAPLSWAQAVQPRSLPGLVADMRASTTYAGASVRAALRTAIPTRLKPRPTFVSPTQRSHGASTAASAAMTATSTITCACSSSSSVVVVWSMPHIANASILLCAASRLLSCVLCQIKCCKATRSSNAVTGGLARLSACVYHLLAMLFVLFSQCRANCASAS